MRLSNDNVAYLLNLVDRNKDGMIEYAEFQDLVLAEDNVSAMMRRQREEEEAAARSAKPATNYDEKFQVLQTDLRKLIDEAVTDMAERPEVDIEFKKGMHALSHLLNTPLAQSKNVQACSVCQTIGDTRHGPRLHQSLALLFHNTTGLAGGCALGRPVGADNVASAHRGVRD